VTSDKFHSLLRRQLKRHLGDGAPSPDLARFVEAVDEAYREFDADRAMLERSLELSSQELLQANSEMRAIVQAIPDLIFRLALDGTILDCRAGTAADLLASARDLVGKSVFAVPSAEVGQAFREAFARLQATRATTSCEYRLEVHGQEQLYEARLLSLLETQVIAFVRNITERKQRDQELLRLSKLESVAVLAGGIAHDFNNILAAVVGNLSVAKDLTSPSTELHEILCDSEAAALRAKKLVKQLLTFSKGGEPVRKVTQLGELLRDWTRFALSGSNVGSSFAIAEDLWPVDVDEGQIGQVVDNLVINAKQAMPLGGALSVAAANVTLGAADAVSPLPPGRYIRVAVKDGGVGIRKEDLPRIFDPYFTTKKSGSGLGLATVYAIVKRHGGHVTVTSHEGVGSEFAVLLPAADAGPCLGAERGVAPRGRGRVLVMDDEELVRRTARRMLEHLGYACELASDGAEAVAAYRSARLACRPFDAVIMDLTVPGGLGGKDALRELLALDPQVKAIVSSGYSEEPIMADYRRHGFCGIVMKPYAVEELAQALHAVVGWGAAGR
jgi:signal transduction histidine kinase/ActR/RegA family two-component response regulator